MPAIEYKVPFLRCTVSDRTYLLSFLYRAKYPTVSWRRSCAAPMHILGMVICLTPSGLEYFGNLRLFKPVTVMKVAAIIPVAFIVSVKRTHIPFLWSVPSSLLPYTNWLVTDVSIPLFCRRCQASSFSDFPLKTKIVLSSVENIIPGKNEYIVGGAHVHWKKYSRYDQFLCSMSIV